MVFQQLLSATGVCYLEPSFSTLSVHHMKSEDLTIKITRSSFLRNEWGMRISFTVIDIFKWSLMDSPVVCILHLHVQTSLCIICKGFIHWS